MVENVGVIREWHAFENVMNSASAYSLRALASTEGTGAKDGYGDAQASIEIAIWVQISASNAGNVVVSAVEQVELSSFFVRSDSAVAKVRWNHMQNMGGVQQEGRRKTAMGSAEFDGLGVAVIAASSRLVGVGHCRGSEIAAPMIEFRSSSARDGSINTATWDQVLVDGIHDNIAVKADYTAICDRYAALKWCLESVVVATVEDA